MFWERKRVIYLFVGKTQSCYLRLSQVQVFSALFTKTAWTIIVTVMIIVVFSSFTKFDYLNCHSPNSFSGYLFIYLYFCFVFPSIVVSDIPRRPAGCEWHLGEAGEGGQPANGLPDLLWPLWKCQPAVPVLGHPELAHCWNTHPCRARLHKYRHCSNIRQRQVGSS